MYVKYKLRNATGLVIPKGPKFSSAKTTSCSIDGTVIKLRAPKYRKSRYTSKPILPKRTYKMDDMFFRSTYSEGFNVSDNWKAFKFFYNSWAFYGSWFTGVVAELEMFFKLVKPVNYKNDDFSLFHPRAFEKIVGDYLTNDFSTRKNSLMGNKHEYIAPVNWQPLRGYPMVAVRLEVIPDISVATFTGRTRQTRRPLNHARTHGKHHKQHRSHLVTRSESPTKSGISGVG